MIKFVSLIFTLILLGGVARLLAVYRTQTELLPDPERAIKKRKNFVSAALNIAIAGFGLFSLCTGLNGPLDILVGVIVMAGLIEVGIRNWTPKVQRAPRCLARDIRTGESLGEVTEECRELSTGAIAAYKIRTHQGQMIERPVNNVTIESMSE